MSQDFKLFSYDEYIRRINKIVGVTYNSKKKEYESRDPDMVQELLLSLSIFENKILEGKSSIRGRNLILFIDGFLKRTYLSKNTKKIKKESKFKIIDSDLSTFDIEDTKQSEEMMITKLCLQEILQKAKLTEEEIDFLTYHKLKIKKNEIKKELNLTEEEYKIKKHSLYNKLSRDKDWSDYV